jgi:hypothetical protein
MTSSKKNRELSRPATGTMDKRAKKTNGGNNLGEKPSS